MSLQANPLMYLNMGGEMLYILRQRLKAQRISTEKSVRVLDEVGMALLDPLVVTKLFQQSAPINLIEIRSILKRAVLSSIMRLDESSMSKLFDLIIMMVKYQIEAVTGPRELLLVTLNHVDFIRDMIVNSSGHESVAILHRMLLGLYGNLTYDEMWQVRKACFDSLANYNVRVSILLRLGLQKENGRFNLPKNRNYDERYEERREDLWNVKILENSCQECNIGSLELFGDRVTFLGGNMYSPTYGTGEKSEASQSNNCGNNARLAKRTGAGSKAELGMLAVQLRSEEDTLSALPEKKPRPFTLQLFPENEIGPEEQERCGSIEKEDKTERKAEDVDCEIEPILNDEYRAKLDHIYAELLVEGESEENVLRKMELLELMDQLE